jgi:hypothetical protein
MKDMTLEITKYRRIVISAVTLSIFTCTVLLSFASWTGFNDSAQRPPASSHDSGDPNRDLGTADVEESNSVNSQKRVASGKAEIQLALTKICVSEAGFQVRTRDCDLIYEVLRNRSVTGEISMGIMRAYARKAFEEDRDDSRMWIPHLNREFTEPRGWSENVTVPWSTRRDKFIEVYNYVGDLLRRSPGHTCGVRIDHWGARGFRKDLHLSRGWKLLDCGKTHNDFWSLPRRRSEDRVASEEAEHETSS